MKAYILKGINNLCYEDCDLPSLKNGWALVKVKASGICSSDVPRIYYKGTYHFPTIPGHEFSGIVVKVASDDDGGWLNKRVGVFPLIPCKTCEQCASKHYEMCSNYNYLGSRCDGGFAEYVAVPVWNLIELPDNVSFEEGAMLEPLAVALHCINQADIKSSNKVAVVGSGMIAFASAQWAKIKGAENVCVIGRSDKKKIFAEKLSINYKTIHQAESDQYDIVVEAVGSNSSLLSSISLVRAGGKLVLMGNPEGDMQLPQNIYWRILRKQLHLIGTWNSSYDGANKSEWIDVKEAMANKLINSKLLITQRFKQDGLLNGLDIIKNNTVPYCKVMVDWNE